MTDTMTPVLNTWNNEVVMLPLDNPTVIMQAKTIKIEGFELLGIDDNDYDELVAELELPELTGDETKDYFVKRCNAVAGYGTPMLSDHGYGEVFGILTDAGFNIKTMMEELHRIINTWHEGTPDDILHNLDINQDNMDDSDKLGAAITAVMDHDHMGYECEYELEGVATILYSEG